MKNFNLCILMGLPGSGKTTFCKSLCDAYRADVDKMLVTKLNKKEEVNKLIDVFNASKYSFASMKTNYKYFVLDGPFFTNNDVVDFITAIWEECSHYKREFPFTGITIHHWNEDREQCILNDEDRRKEPSKQTIKSVKYEKVDKKRLKELFNVPITVVEHKVYNKPEWQNFFEDKVKSNNEYLTSESWVTGGRIGNCWNDEFSYLDADTPYEFEEFDALLEKICPNITFLQYKKLRAACVESDTSHTSEYYGGYTDYAYWKCYLPTLYEKLNEMNLIERVE